MSGLRNIPPMDELLEAEAVQQQLQRFNRGFVIANLKQAVADIRQELRVSGQESSREDLGLRIVTRLDRLLWQTSRGTLQKVINATGVVLHTNLGRAPLCKRALAYLQDMGRDYNNLEYDLESGERGSRYHHVEELLIKLTGAEAGLVVNNNAAAVLLGLNTLAQGCEVIVSRGQLIEIGGAFRIPEVMKQSGAKLVEVGTTNRTYISDYANAINENTALLFAAHTSNYKVIGFSAEAQLDELVDLGKARQIPVMQDLGSGILADLSEWGLKEEPTVQESVRSGADIITFSGDKLLGGPQAGIMVGRGSYVERMKKNQLTRALRVDKMSIAALEGTLLEYLCGDPLENIPVLKMLTTTSVDLAARAEALKQALQGQLQNGEVVAIHTASTDDRVGGGAYPTYQLPGFAVQLVFSENRLESVVRRLRAMEPALVTRIKDNSMHISVRTLNPGDETLLIELLAAACGPKDAED
ncbi:MAG: L-seryl-tRNA(Sec) selenium transferase [Syntrophomonadaceae bacterium]|nr:L-seryl-tRNA(Sec) selenium transferase [Syntrophomonadaceae bacterium]